MLQEDDFELMEPPAIETSAIDSAINEKTLSSALIELSLIDANDSEGVTQKSLPVGGCLRIVLVFEEHSEDESVILIIGGSFWVRGLAAYRSGGVFACD